MNTALPAGPDSYAHLLTADNGDIAQIKAVAKEQGWTNAQVNAAIAEAKADAQTAYSGYWS